MLAVKELNMLLNNQVKVFYLSDMRYMRYMHDMRYMSCDICMTYSIAEIAVLLDPRCNKTEINKATVAKLKLTELKYC